MTSWTPCRPRCFRVRRNPRQNTSSSESPTSRPRISRPPSAVTAVATTTAIEVTCPPPTVPPGRCGGHGGRWRRGTRTGTRCGAAAGPGTPSTCSSSPAQIRLTSDFEMPDPMPNAATRSSTARVETPFTQASITTAYRAWSIRRRRSRMTGKNEPCRSFGIRSSTSPAWVATSRGRVPFRSVDAALAAFVAAGADDLGGLGLDEFLHDQPDRLTDQIHALPGAERLEQLGCDRLRQRHRWEPPDEYLPVHIENPADGALTVDDSPNPETPPPQGTREDTSVRRRGLCGSTVGVVVFGGLGAIQNWIPGVDSPMRTMSSKTTQPIGPAVSSIRRLRLPAQPHTELTRWC